MQRPRLERRPPDVVSIELADQALELAARFGLVVDEWQAYDLQLALGIRPDGKWAASEVGIDCPRQNGKGGILEVRQLAGIYLFGDRLQVHTAHVFDTAEEHFLRIQELIDGAPKRYKDRTKIRTANGQQAITYSSLDGRRRLRFRARKGGGGRGLSGDTVYIDESMIIRPGVMSALRFAMRARPNPQLWLTGSAPIGDPTSNEWRTTISQAENDTEPRLAFAGHSIDPDDIPDKTVTEQRVLELASISNPSLSDRIAHETVLQEFRKARESIEPNAWQEWLRETLGVPDPSPYEIGEAVIDMTAWAARADEASTVDGKLVLGVAVSPDRKRAALGIAGRRAGDDGWHVENIEHREYTHWVAESVVKALAKHDVVEIVLDALGPAGSMAKELVEAGVDEDLIHSETTTGYKQACSILYDLVVAGAEDEDADRVFHRAQPELTAQLDGAEKKTLGDAWLWRRTDEGDITVLESCTLALGRAVGRADEPTSKKAPNLY